MTNSYGDLQQVKKAADRAGVRTDFEMIVRIAGKMGADVRKLVPFGPAGTTAGTRADMGQTRGAQSGEADRHAVWLTANNLEPRLSPFDPSAILDEIQRVVPGYTSCCACNCSPATTSTSRPRCAHPRQRAWCRSATAATWSSPPTTRSSPPARLPLLADASTTCNRTRPGEPHPDRRPDRRGLDTERPL